MANCKSYQRLHPREKTELVGKVIHALQNDETCFEMGVAMVQLAKEWGIFEDVIINPAGGEDQKMQAV